MSHSNEDNSRFDALEEALLKLESENHQLKRQIKHFEFERYKFQEVQRLAKAGTWELNHLTYDLSISNELAKLLWGDDEPSKGLSWQAFLGLFVCNENMDEKQKHSVVKMLTIFSVLILKVMLY